MNSLVRDEIADHKLWRQNESPVEREVLPPGAIAPLGALTHYVDTTGVGSKTRGERGKLSLDLCSRLLPKPILKTTFHRSPGRLAMTNDNLAINEVDSVPAVPCLGRLDAHRGRLPTKEDLPGRALRRSSDLAKSSHTLELVENPRAVFVQERGDVLAIAAMRLNDFDTI